MKEGIPKEVLDELNIKIKKPKETILTISAIVEKHQTKLPIPATIRRELEISKGQKLTVSYSSKTKTIAYQL